jgi:TolB-like protein/Flp pilus assembly protein TadD
MSQMGSFFRELRVRRIVQIALIYLGVAWGLAEATGFAIENYELSRKLLDVIVLLLILGFPAAMVLAWYHGERGHQQLQRGELMILTTLFVLGVIGTYRISTAEETPIRSVSEVIEPVADLGRGSVAVLPFANNTGVDSLDWLGAGVSDLLTSSLAQHDELSVVSPQRLFDLLRAQGRDETERIPDRFAMEIATRSGARVMARGSILAIGSELAIDVQLIELSDGTVLAAERARGEDVFALADTLAQRLSVNLLGEFGPAPPSRSPLALTGDLGAYRQYQRDLRGKWRQLEPTDIDGRYRLAAMYEMMPGRTAEGRAVLEEIVGLDESSAPAFYDLAELAVREGDMRAADAYITRYLALQPEEETSGRLLGELYEKAGRYDEARGAYRKLVGGKGEQTELLDLLVRTHLRENRPTAAREELEPYSQSSDPAVRFQAALLLADTYAWEGRFEQALERYAEAEAIAEAANLPALRAQAMKSAVDVEDLLESEHPSVFNPSIWTLLEMDKGARALNLVEAADALYMRGSTRLSPVDHHVLAFARARALEAMGFAAPALRLYGEVRSHWGDAAEAVPLLAELEERARRLQDDRR